MADGEREVGEWETSAAPPARVPRSEKIAGVLRPLQFHTAERYRYDAERDVIGEGTFG